MNRLVIDLETLGTSPDAHVVSLGGAFVRGPAFEVVLPFDGQRHRRIDRATLSWWLTKGSRELLLAHLDVQQVPLEKRLGLFLEWMRHCGPLDEVWCNGAAFDFPILRSLLQDVGAEPPWSYWQERDLRTLRAIRADVPWPKMAHTARQDAALGAGWLGEVFRVTERDEQ